MSGEGKGKGEGQGGGAEPAADRAQLAAATSVREAGVRSTAQIGLLPAIPDAFAALGGSVKLKT